jgi:hypothetical protein
VFVVVTGHTREIGLTDSAVLVNVTACARELMHGALLRAVGHHLELEGVQLFHFMNLIQEAKKVQFFAFILALKDEVFCFLMIKKACFLWQAVTDVCFDNVSAGPGARCIRAVYTFYLFHWIGFLMYVFFKCSWGHVHHFSFCQFPRSQRGP